MIRRVGFILFLILVSLVPLCSSYYITLGSYIGLYSLVAVGLVLLTGVAGLTSFGQAAFMGVAAYTTAMLTVKFGWSPWLTLLIALALTMAIAFVLGAITLRMGGITFRWQPLPGASASFFSSEPSRHWAALPGLPISRPCSCSAWNCGMRRYSTTSYGASVLLLSGSR